MLESLLVPLDGTEFSERSLALAGGLARSTGAKLHVAHVHATYMPDQLLSNTQFHFEGLDLDEYDNRHREEERTYLDGIMVRLGAEGADDVDVALLDGQVAQQIASYAQSIQADVILMTTHGYAGMSRLRLGSVTDALIRLTTLPILLLHPGQHGSVPPDVSSFRHIFVPLDGSLLAETILDPATDLARAHGARLTLFNAASPSGVFGMRLLPLLPDTLTPELEEKHDYLERVAEGLRKQGLDVAVEVAANDAPARAIVEAAERFDADVIALASHGYGGLKRAILGSVADKVLHRTSLPLLVRRPE
jgi:nucleotide-binding universal stress UspA family protein